MNSRSNNQILTFLFIGVLIGALISSADKGVTGFGYAFLVMGILSFILVIASFFLKSRKKEYVNGMEQK